MTRILRNQSGLAWMAALWLMGAAIPLSAADSVVEKKDSRAARTPTPQVTPNPKLAPPVVKPGHDNLSFPVMAPATLPNVKFPDRVEPTPTPVPGRVPKDPTAAAIFSALVPGLGHVYGREPLKGIFFAAAFGVSTYLSVDNFRLVKEPNSDERVARNETAGSLYGLAALAAYGFSIQDAYNSARRYNRRQHFGVTLAPVPRPMAMVRMTF